MSVITVTETPFVPNTLVFLSLAYLGIPFQLVILNGSISRQNTPEVFMKYKYIN